MKLAMSLLTFTLVLLVANVAAQGNMFKVPVAPCNGECRNLITGFSFLLSFSSGVHKNVESLADRLESESEIPGKQVKECAANKHFLFLSLLPASVDLLTSDCSIPANLSSGNLFKMNPIPLRCCLHLKYN